jgi:hypothetical protein
MTLEIGWRLAGTALVLGLAWGWWYFASGGGRR